MGVICNDVCGLQEEAKGDHVMGGEVTALLGVRTLS